MSATFRTSIKVLAKLTFTNDYDEHAGVVYPLSFVTTLLTIVAKAAVCVASVAAVEEYPVVTGAVSFVSPTSLA